MKANITKPKKYILVYRDFRIFYLGYYNGHLDTIENKEEATIFSKEEAEDMRSILANKKNWFVEEV